MLKLKCNRDQVGWAQSEAVCWRNMFKHLRTEATKNSCAEWARWAKCSSQSEAAVVTATDQEELRDGDGPEAIMAAENMQRVDSSDFESAAPSAGQASRATLRKAA